MNWSWLSGASGITLGTILGLLAKTAYDLATESRRRQFERSMRFLDTGLAAVVAFLAATEWARKCHEVEVAAGRAADDARKSGNQPAAAEWLAKGTQASQEASVNRREAHTSLTTLYLLSPQLGNAAHDYLTMCTDANHDTETGRQRREELRRETEARARLIFKAPYATGSSRWARF